MKQTIIEQLRNIRAKEQGNVPLGALHLTKRLGANNRQARNRNYGYLKRDFNFPDSDCPCNNTPYEQLSICPTTYTTERCLTIRTSDFSTFDSINIENVFQKEIELLLQQHSFEVANVLYSLIGFNAYTGNSNPLYLPDFIANCDVNCDVINLSEIAGFNGIILDGSLLGTGNIIAAKYGNSSMAYMIRSRFAIYEDLTYSSQYNVNTVLLIDNQRVNYYTTRTVSPDDLAGFDWHFTHINVSVTEDKCIGEGWVVRFFIDWGLCAQEEENGSTGVYHLVFDEEPVPCEIGIRDGESGTITNNIEANVEIPLSGGAIELTNYYSYFPVCCEDSISEGSVIVNYSLLDFNGVIVDFATNPHPSGNNQLTITLDPLQVSSGQITIRLISPNCDRWTLLLNYNIV